MLIDKVKVRIKRAAISWKHEPRVYWFGTDGTLVPCRPDGSYQGVYKMKHHQTEVYFKVDTLNRVRLDS